MNTFLQALGEQLADVFDPARAGTVLATLLAGAVIAAAVFLAYWVAWQLLRFTLRTFLKRMAADATSSTFAQTVLKYAVLGLGLVQALDAAGVNMAGILASLGVVGLSIGFAARDALSNVVSGILIFWDRPFVLGDLVEIDGKYGRVDRITLRSTRVITPDGRMLAVPNTAVINTTVASYTNFPHLRIEVPVTIGVNEDLARVRGILLPLVQSDAAYMAEPKPTVSVTALNDYNIEVRLDAWIADERDHVAKRAALREQVFEALRSNGVDMPFETLALQPIEVRKTA